MHALRSNPVRGSLFAALFVIVAGCSSGGDAEPVTGTVTFDGAPLADGRITFEPAGQQGSGGGAVIADGSYSVPGGDVGLLPGSYRVSISAVGGGSSADDAPGAGGPAAMGSELIPAKYNTDSELTAEVTADGDNTFDFDLQP